jgi:hypothetical protein
MTPSAQLAEIRERIAQMSPEDQRMVRQCSYLIADLACADPKYGRLALALVSAEMAVEVKP